MQSSKRHRLKQAINPPTADTAAAAMGNDDILTDDYVAGLLAKDASDCSIKYSAMGLEAFRSDKKCAIHPPIQPPSDPELEWKPTTSNKGANVSLLRLTLGILDRQTCPSPIRGF